MTLATVCWAITAASAVGAAWVLVEPHLFAWLTRARPVGGRHRHPAGTRAPRVHDTGPRLPRPTRAQLRRLREISQ